MITADDIDDVANQVQADIDEWLPRVMAVFQKGALNRAADTMWRNQPDEMKNVTRQQMPEVATLLDSVRKSGGV